MTTITGKVKKENFIDYIKCILLMGVVAIHSDVCVDAPTDVNVAGSYVVEFFSKSLTLVCVPTFFLLSGYLYFYNINNYKLKDYIYKTKSRAFTLLIPYLLWNLIGLIIQIGKSVYLNFPSYGLIEGGNLSLEVAARGFWEFTNGYPFAFAFWFIRNLIIFVLLAPVAYLIGGKNQYILFLFLIVIFVFNIPLWGFEYFILGCAMSMLFKSKINNIKPTVAWIGLIVWIGLALIRLFGSTEHIEVLVKMSMTVGAFIFLMYFIKKHQQNVHGKLVSIFVSSTFYIYAIHQFFCTVTRNLFIKKLGLSTFVGVTGSFLCSLITMIVVSFIIWFVLKRIMPRVMNLLGGNR